MPGHDQQMRALTHPDDWMVTLADEYDFVAIGGGTAGLVATAGAAQLGARTLLIERELLGGDCLVSGCVPSKALLHAARLAHDARNAGKSGVKVSGVEVDFAAVMEAMREKRAEIAQTDSASAWARRGVEIIFGQASFVGRRSLVVDGQRIRFKRALIATGARPKIPEIPGLSEVDPLTSASLFDLVELPRRLAIIGGGPIGVEMGQALARLGSTVTIIEAAPRVLADEEPEASALLTETLLGEGIGLICNAQVERVSRHAETTTLMVRVGNHQRKVVCDRVLTATGRTPNIETLELDRAKVGFDAHGIRVNPRQQTTNRRIYAAGDVCSAQKFTHAAWAQAEYAVLNALLPMRRSMAKRWIPRVIYTDPEVAHVGASAAELMTKGVKITTLCVGLDQCDRARIEGETQGFAQVHLKRGSDRILGATVVCRQAGEVIAQLGLAMQMGLGLGAAATTVYAYPTRNELVSRLADAYNFERVTPGLRRIIGWWLRWAL